MSKRKETWNLRTLKELMDERAQAAQRAIEEVKDGNEKRFESVNEFRAQASDQTRTYVTRVEVEAKLQGQSEKLDTTYTNLSDRIDRMNAGYRVSLITIAVAFIATITTVIFVK